jgi:hypothetical protein
VGRLKVHVSNSASAAEDDGRDATRSYFVRVPVSASALKVDMTGGGAEPGTGQIRFMWYPSQGLPLDSNSSLSCYDRTRAPAARRTAAPWSTRSRASESCMCGVAPALPATAKPSPPGSRRHLSGRSVVPCPSDVIR